MFLEPSIAKLNNLFIFDNLNSYEYLFKTFSTIVITLILFNFYCYAILESGNIFLNKFKCPFVLAL